MPRRIKKLDVHFVSLCPRGANTLSTMYKEDKAKSDGSIPFESQFLIAKEMTDQGQLLAVVYAPELVDSQGDVASKEVIREAMKTWARNGYALDLQHNNKRLDKSDAYVVQTFEIISADDRFSMVKDYDGKPVDVTGGWALEIQIDNPDLRKNYREGQWAGVSMGGMYLTEAEKQEVTVPEEAQAASLFHRVMKAMLASVTNQNTPEKDELDMKADELQKLLEENNKTLASSIVEGLTKALSDGKPPQKVEKTDDEGRKPEDKKLTFDGDPSDPKAVQKHLEKLARQELVKGVDWNDMASVQAYQKKLAELEGEADTDDDQQGEAIVRTRKSNQPTSDAAMSKEERESMASAKSILAKLPASRIYKQA